MNKKSEHKKVFILTSIVVLVCLLIFLFVPDLFKKGNENLIKNTSAGKVNLIITSEYEEYFIDQDIWIKVSVVNNSNENYFLKWPLTLTYTHFAGTYPSGKKINEIPTDDSIEPKDSLKLDPGGSFEKVMSLNKLIGKFYNEDKKEIGVYKINARYQDLNSNELNIDVTEPTDIDKELYDQTYLQLFKPEIPRYEKIQKLAVLLNKYPGSKYSPQLYKMYFDESKFTKDYNNNSEEIVDFFKYNHDTYGADLILEIGNVNFEKLLSKYRDSKTGYMIRQRRKETLTHK